MRRTLISALLVLAAALLVVGLTLSKATGKRADFFEGWFLCGCHRGKGYYSQSIGSMPCLTKYSFALLKGLLPK